MRIAFAPDAPGAAPASPAPGAAAAATAGTSPAGNPTGAAAAPAPEVKLKADATSLIDVDRGAETKDAGSAADGKGADQDAAPKSLVFKDRPDWLQEKFWDAKTGEVRVEAIAKAEADLRKKLGASSKAPEKPDGYKFELADDAKKHEAWLQGGLDKDPLVGQFKGWAHRHGLSPQQANGLLNDYLQFAGDNSPAPINAQEEFKKLGPQAGPMIRFVNDKLEMWKSAGVIKEAHVDEARILCQTAAGVEFFCTMAQAFGEQMIPAEMQGAPADEAALSSELEQLMKDAAAGKPGTDARFVEYQKKLAKARGLAA